MKTAEHLRALNTARCKRWRDTHKERSAALSREYRKRKAAAKPPKPEKVE